MGFSRQEHWNRLPFPSLGDLLNPGIEPVSSMSPAWQVDSLPLSYVGSNKLYWDVKCLEHLPNYQITNGVVKKKTCFVYMLYHKLYSHNKYYTTINWLQNADIVKNKAVFYNELLHFK